MREIIIHGIDLKVKKSRDMMAPSDRRETIVITGPMRSPSDGHHTFDELYDHRAALFIAACKLMMETGGTTWKSMFHSDGSPTYKDMFIMGIGKQAGRQITYHLDIKWWKDCSKIPTVDIAPEWDKHTSSDVIKRLIELI